VYTNAAERALVGDCRAYVLEATAPANAQNLAPQADITSLSNNLFWLSGGAPAQGESSYDYYRHGKYPKHVGNGFDTKGGKVLFNVLFADGHVSGLTTREEGFKAARQRFPG
jgi:prepilin-type processing-associated H-X9-DG protein